MGRRNFHRDHYEVNNTNKNSIPMGCCFCVAGSRGRLSHKRKRIAVAILFLLVETTGIEPVTPCMSSKYSNQLSYASEQK